MVAGASKPIRFSDLLLFCVLKFWSTPGLNFSVPETMHPDPKAPEEETVEEGTVEGAVGGGMEEQVIGEVWKSQEGEEEEVAAEGEGEEESDGEGVSFLGN